ncbi:hypothetical protein SDC9_178554 [bioreactor metagenome]|uniref:Uncharacterized protein n=1 Tax=bioreactor metagenome TaxID=1076179 RepID=A0A645GXH9_9ZZZZ
MDAATAGAADDRCGRVAEVADRLSFPHSIQKGIYSAAHFPVGKSYSGTWRVEASALLAVIEADYLHILSDVDTLFAKQAVHSCEQQITGTDDG